MEKKPEQLNLGVHRAMQSGIVFPLVFVWILLLIEGLALVIIMREIGRIHLRLGPPYGARGLRDGLDIGSLVPPVTAKDQYQQQREIGGKSTKPLLLLFMAVGCPSCRSLSPALETFQRGYPELDVVVAIESDGRSVEGMLARENLEKIRCFVDGNLARHFQIRIYPYAILLDTAGRVISKGVVNNLEHLESLVHSLEQRQKEFASTVHWV
jgi:methylamine dehydrogenase accessory protein MauD